MHKLNLKPVMIGLRMNYFSFMTDGEVGYVHECSLEILEETGLLVRNEKARNRFAKHGAIVDHETEIVKIPSDIVEKYRKMVPPTITASPDTRTGCKVSTLGSPEVIKKLTSDSASFPKLSMASAFKEWVPTSNSAVASV